MESVMSADSPVERWRTWPRKGDYIDAPADSTMEERLAAMWALTCEKYGIDPDNPPPMRKDVFRIGRLRDQ
jgi:hypothetical protein